MEAFLIRLRFLLLVCALGSCASAADEHSAEQLFLRTARLWTPAAISTVGYESSPTFTPDGLEMYFVRADQNFRDYEILRSRCVKGEWAAPDPVPFGLRLPVVDADPHVTRDGDRLYFISSRNAPEREDFDIWTVARKNDGNWDEPERLPEPVNSPHSELLPRIGGDGTLYFGSDRPGGYGQSDIYAARQEANGSWTVVNLAPPVSTAANDYEAEVSFDGKALILVSDRGDKSHLYLFEKHSETWVETARIPASRDEFQVGPTLSPAGDRLLFAQASEGRSGEMFLIDLKPNPDRSWPPCGAVINRRSSK